MAYTSEMCVKYYIFGCLALKKQKDFDINKDNTPPSTCYITDINNWDSYNN